MCPGMASVHAGAERRACRAPTAIHPTRIIRRARRGASSATIAWMTDDDRCAIPGHPRAAGDDGHLAGLDHWHPARACMGIPVNRVGIIAAVVATSLVLPAEARTNKQKRPAAVQTQA